MPSRPQCDQAAMSDFGRTSAPCLALQRKTAGVRLKSDTEPLTVGEVLKRSTDHLAQKGSETPRLDAERLLGHALGLERVELYMHLDRPLSPAMERSRVDFPQPEGPTMQRSSPSATLSSSPPMARCASSAKRRR